MTTNITYCFFTNETRESRFQAYNPAIKTTYMIAYVGGIDAENTQSDAINYCSVLGSLYEKFNINHPSDYRNRSMSVGDVVNLVHGTESKWFACMPTGWLEIEEPESVQNKFNGEPLCLNCGGYFAPVNADVKPSRYDRMCTSCCTFQEAR